MAVIDYDFGNVRSVLNALESLGVQSCLSREPSVLKAASHLILPGVGAFGDGIKHLKTMGLIPLLEELVFAQKRPFLGICVGMQLLAQKGFEGGEHDGLGWIDANVIRFASDMNTPSTSTDDAVAASMPVSAKKLKVPHVGWNDVYCEQDNPLLGKAGSTNAYYFVHSYYVQCPPPLVVGRCDYGIPFPAVIQQDNIFAVQFHPEKSQKAGLQLLENFLQVSTDNGEGS